MPDSTCTRCHARLEDHVSSPMPASRVETHIGKFDIADHPEFRSLENETKPTAGRIKFNHKRHLTPGMPLEQGGSVLTYRDLSESNRSRYGMTKNDAPDAPVRLDCASCHRLDPAGFSDATSNEILHSLAPDRKGRI